MIFFCHIAVTTWESIRKFLFFFTFLYFYNVNFYIVFLIFYSTSFKLNFLPHLLKHTNLRFSNSNFFTSSRRTKKKKQ